MEIRMEIYNKALNTIQYNNEKEEYIRVCKKAGLCPKCGKEVYSKTGHQDFYSSTQYFCHDCGRIYY